MAEAHLPFLVELNSDPVVHRFLFHRGLTAEETEARLRGALAAAAEVDGLGQWVGEHDGEPIGLWTLQPPDGPSQPQVPGEADLGLSRIVAQTMAVNEASRATMASVGLTFVRGFAEEFDVPVPGHEQGEVEYEITRERWSSSG